MVRIRCDNARMRKSRISVSLSAKAYEKLAKEAEDLGLSIGEVLRRIIDRYFERR